MASTKDLKKRISTVKNTQQTTRAMKMVSAAKLRRAQDSIQNQRPYAKRISELIKILASQIEEKNIPSLVRKKKEIEIAASKMGSWPEGWPGSLEVDSKIVLVVLTSDRGLCGAFNGNIIKATQRWLTSYQSEGKSLENLKFIFIGKRGYDFFKNKGIQVHAFYPELGGKVTFAKAKTLADNLIKLYLSEGVDEVKFIYNEFKNAVTQKVVVEDFLPVLKEEPIEAVSTVSAPVNPMPDILVEPSLDEVMNELLTRNFSIQAFRILLESQAGEHGARMSAMENATKNAGEMIRKLTLQYNKQRQAGITKELLEIIAGSESQKS